MTDYTIERGMSVWLRSGGPEMSVKTQTGNGSWLCSWFVGADVKEHAFMAEQLTDQNPNAPAIS